jgi:hypothetical protein
VKDNIPAESKANWLKTPFANLVRYVPSGIYFARIRVRGKLIRRSLKTNKLAVAKHITQVATTIRLILFKFILVKFVLRSAVVAPTQQARQANTEIGMWGLALLSLIGRWNYYG